MAEPMLFVPQAETLVKRSFADAKWRSDYHRRVEASQRLDILEEDWKDLLWAKILSIYKSEKIRDSVRGLMSTEHNVYKRIVKELSTVYKWPAKRGIRDDKRQDEIAQLLWKEARMDAVLRQGNFYTNGLRDVLVIPYVAEGRMRLRVLTPDRYSVLQNPADPTEMQGFWYERTLSQTLGRDDIEIVYGDAEVWRIYSADGSRVLDERPHVLGRVPAVAIHAEERIDTFFSPSSMSSVVDATFSIGWMMVMLARLQYLQSELQVTYQGNPSDLARGKTQGGDEIWAAQGLFTAMNLQADPSKYIDHINARIAWIAEQHGLAADVYRLSDNPDSGLKFRLKRLPLLEARAAQQLIWREKEHELYQLMALVAKREHPLLKPDPGAEFFVNFGDEPFVEDPLVQNRIWKERIELGVHSPARVLQEIDPDLDKKQARAELKEIVEERGEWVEMVREMQAPADPTKPVGPSPEENGAAGGQARGGGMRAAVAAALKKVRVA